MASMLISAVEVLIVYIVYFFAIFIFALLLDVFGVFDSFVSYFALKSYRNLSEAIHRSRCKREYAKQLAQDRYDRLPMHSKFLRCCTREKINESELDIDEVEREYQRWKEIRKLRENRPENKSGCKWGFHEKEKFSEYYFTELLNLSYLGTTKYHHHAPSEKLSIFGLFNIHFSKGFLSDFLFYIMNNHSFLSMFMAVRGHPFSRNARRLTYLSANCLTFFAAVFVTRLDPTTAKVVSVLAISPLTIAVRKWMYALLACPLYRPVLERGERDCKYHCLSCLGVSAKVFAYFLVLLFMTILLPAALFTLSSGSNIKHAKYFVLNYVQSVTVTSFGQEFLYAFLVFWTGEACVSIKVFGVTVLGYGGYYRDKVHILGLRGLRLQQLRLTVMQEKLEQRQDTQRRLESTASNSSSSVAVGGITNPAVHEEQEEEEVSSLSQDQHQQEEQLTAASLFRRSVTIHDVPPSILHRYDYAIQNLDWLRYLTCSVVDVEFFVSIPFVREFVREFSEDGSERSVFTFSQDSQAIELGDIDKSLYNDDNNNNNSEREESMVSNYPDRMLSKVVDSWNQLFVSNATSSSSSLEKEKPASSEELTMAETSENQKKISADNLTDNVGVNIEVDSPMHDV